MSASTAVFGPTLGLTPVASKHGELRLEGRVQSGTEGITVRRLRLKIPGTSSSVGLDELRPYSTQLERLEIAIDLELVLGAHLELSDLRCSNEGSDLVIEARRNGMVFISRVRFIPGSLGSRGHARTLIIDLGVPSRLGIQASIDTQLLTAFEKGLSEPSGWLARCSPYVTLIDPITSLLRGIFPRNGWKLPGVDDLYLAAAVNSSSVLVISLGPEAPLAEESVITARRSELLAHLDAYGFDETSSDAKMFFVQDLARLGSDLKPKATRNRALWAASQTSEFADEAWSLVNRILLVDPGDETALGAKMYLAQQRQVSAAAKADSIQQYAMTLRNAGERRRPSLILLASAPFVHPELRARFLEEAVVWSPNEPRTLEALSQALIPLGRLEAAIRALRRLAMLSDRPEAKGRVHLQAAQLLAKRGDLAGAQRELDRARQHTPEAPEVLVMLAQTKARRGEVESAWSDLVRAADRAEDRPNDRSLLLESLARLRFEHGDVDAAVPVIETALKIATQPPPPELVSLLLEIAKETQNQALMLRGLEAAERRDEHHLAQDPECVTMHRTAAIVCEHLGEPERGLEHLRHLWCVSTPTEDDFLRALRLVELAGSSLEDVRELARLAIRTGALEQAVSAWRQIHERLPVEERRWPDAWIDLHQAIHRNPRSSVLLDAAVSIARDNAEPSAFSELVQTRLRLDSTNEERAELLVLLAQSWRARGRPMAAVRTLEEAVEYDASRLDAHELLADIHRARDDQPRLANVLYKLAKLSSGSKRGVYQAERARILAALGEDFAAHEAVIDALDAGDTASVTWSLATVLALRLGKYKEARSRALKRLEITRHEPSEVRLPIWVDLLRIAEAEDDPDQVLHALREAISLAEPSSALGRQLAEQLDRELELRGEFGALVQLELSWGRDQQVPMVDRGGWLAAAAERLVALGRLDEATSVGDEVLALPGSGPAFEANRDRVLRVQENIARSEDQPSQLAKVLRDKAERLGHDLRAQGVWLELIAILKTSDELQDALDTAKSASSTFPDHLELAVHTAELAAEQGDARQVAVSYARAAFLAERHPSLELALNLHAKAARAFVSIKEPELAVQHDEAVVERALRLKQPRPDVFDSLDRLEELARQANQTSKRLEWLDAKSKLSSGSIRAIALEGLANLLVSEGRIDDAIDAFEHALDELAPDELARIEGLEERLDAARASSGRFRDRVPSLERRAKAKSGIDATRLWMRAARVLLDQLDEPEAALVRVRAALRSSPDYNEARTLRLELLRRVGEPNTLVEVLAEEGARANDAQHAAQLWLEASRAALNAVQNGELDPQIGREKAVELARRAAAANPKDPEALCLAIEAVTRLPDREDETLSLLGQLAVRTTSPAERLCCRLRRARLLQESFDNPTSALAELSEVLAAPEGPRRLALRAVLTDGAEPEETFLEWGVDLARISEDPEVEEQFLFQLQQIVKEPERRAELGTRRATLLDFGVADADSAEQAWLEVLSSRPQDPAARSALLQRFIDTGRFTEIVERLGVETLEDAWSQLNGKIQTEAGDALWPYLPEGPRQLEVMLSVADGYLELDEEHSLSRAIQLLEQITKSGVIPFTAMGWQRLAKVRSEPTDLECAAEAESARADASSNPSERAEALASVAEYRLGLGEIEDAELALNLAQAADAHHPRVRNVLRTFLVQQRRFQELGVALGAEVLSEVVRELIQHPSRADEAFAASLALAPLLESQQGRFWLEVANVWTRCYRGDLEHRALSFASRTSSEEAREALFRLAEYAKERGDLEGRVEWLRRSVELVRAEPDGIDLKLSFVEAVREWTSAGGDLASEEDVETILLEARSLKADPRVDAALEQLWLDRADYEQLGRVLGADRLRVHAERASLEGDPDLERKLLRAWAALTVGSQRAQVLIRLADNWHSSGELDAELEAVALAHESDKERDDLRQRFVYHLVELGQFDRFIERLGVDELNHWLEQNSQHSSYGLAGEALARVWQEEGEKSPEEVSLLWASVGKHYQQAGCLEDAERAYRATLTLDPSHAEARTALGDILASYGRYTALAQIDMERLAQAARAAQEAGDLERAQSALRVFAEYSSGQAKADALIDLVRFTEAAGRLVSSTEVALLEEAHRADAGHQEVAERLGVVLWKRRETGRLVQILGFSGFLVQFRRAIKEDTRDALDTLRLARSHLSPRERALANEEVAKFGDINLSAEENFGIRRDALLAARFTWDQLADSEGRSRVRLAMIELMRDSSEQINLRLALEDAWDEVDTPLERASVGLELAQVCLDEEPEHAHAILSALISTPDGAMDIRLAASKILVKAISPKPEEVGSLDVCMRGTLLEAHELLFANDQEETSHTDEDIQVDTEHFLLVASLREANNEAPHLVAEMLGKALEKAPSTELRCLIHQRLRDLWDQVGDWCRAEPHAAAVASSTDEVEDWLALAELRTWIDELPGAEAAAESALSIAPNDSRVHEQRVRLAELLKKDQLLAERLEAYANADLSSSLTLRADRLFRAAELAQNLDQPEDVLRRLEASICLDPQLDRWNAVELILEQFHFSEALLRVYQAGIQSEDLLVSRRARHELVARLADIGQRAEAIDALQQGMTEPMSAEDPLLVMALSIDLNVDGRNLLKWADQLGDGVASVMLRTEAARRAEVKGDLSQAQEAWTKLIMSSRPEVGVTQARSALIRLARQSDDAGYLLNALEEAAEEAGADEAAVDLWLETARVAEETLLSPERAIAILERAYRAIGAPQIQESLVELLERNELWLALDAWLERQRGVAEGPADRARFARMRADRLVLHLHDPATAIQLYSESYKYVASPEVGLTTGKLEYWLGRYEACLQRLDQLLLDDEQLSEEVCLQLILLKVDTLEALGLREQVKLYLEIQVELIPAAEGLLDRLIRHYAENNDVSAALTQLRDPLDSLPRVKKIDRWLMVSELCGIYLNDTKLALSALEHAANLAESQENLSVAKIAFKIGAHDLALKAFNQVGDKTNIDAPVDLLIDRAESALQVEDWGLFDRILSSLPELSRTAHQTRTLTLKGRAFFQQGAKGAARAAWAEAARVLESQKPNDAALLWKRYANAAAQAGETEMALRAAQRVRLLLGEVDKLEDQILLVEVNTEERAEALLARIESETDSNKRKMYWNSIASIYQSLGFVDEAENAQFEANLLGEPTAEFDEISRELEARERWDELFQLLDTRLASESLTEAEEVETRFWLGRLALKLGQPELGKTHLEAIHTSDSVDLEILEALQEVYVRLNMVPEALMILEQLATRAESKVTRRRAMVRAARLYAHREEWGSALNSVIGAIERSESGDLRAWAEYVQTWAFKANDLERAANGWVMYATGQNGAEAAAGLARAAEIRWKDVEDRRAALASVRLAQMHAPNSGTSARIAFELLDELGDDDALIVLTETMGERSQGLAQTAWRLEHARKKSELKTWRIALENEEGRDLVLRHLVAVHHQTPIDDLDNLLAEFQLTLPALSGPSSNPVSYDAHVRLELERSGRFRQLVALDSALVEACIDPREKAEGWLRIADMHGRLDTPTALVDRKVALERAVDADPLWPVSISLALEAALDADDKPRARQLMSSLVELGGPSWSPPRLELIGVQLAEDLAEKESWLEQALRQDPGHRAALEQLAEVKLASGELGEARSLADTWAERIDLVLEPELEARCRKLRSRIARGEGRYDEALSCLEATDVEEHYHALAAADAVPEELSEALEAWFDEDGNPQHLLQAAQLGVRLDALEKRCFEMSSNLELENVLLEQRKQLGQGRSLLSWVRRRGPDILGDVPTHTRWETARTALEQGFVTLVPGLLQYDTHEEGLAEVFGDWPIAALVSALDVGRTSDRKLLERLRQWRPQDQTLVQSLANYDSQSDERELAIEACRDLLRIDVADLRALRRLVELQLNHPDGAGPSMLLSWFESGPSLVLQVPEKAIETFGHRAESSFEVFRLYPWSSDRLQRIQNYPKIQQALELLGITMPGVWVDLLGGERMWYTSNNSIVLGQGLVDVASVRELCFHLASIRTWLNGNQDECPARVGLLRSGSLQASVEGLRRGTWEGFFRPLRSVDDRVEFARSHPVVRDWISLLMFPGLSASAAIESSLIELEPKAAPVLPTDEKDKGAKRYLNRHVASIHVEKADKDVQWVEEEKTEGGSRGLENMMVPPG